MTSETFVRLQEFIVREFVRGRSGFQQSQSLATHIAADPDRSGDKLRNLANSLTA